MSSLAQAQSEMTQIAANLTAKFPAFDTGWSARVVPMHGQITGQDPSSAAVAAGRGRPGAAHRLRERRQPAAGARGLAPEGDRGALRRWARRAASIVATLLAESGLIALGGALVGYGLAYAGLRGLQAQALDTNAIPRLDGVTLDWRVAAVAAARLPPPPPSLRACCRRSNRRVSILRETLRDSSRGATSGRSNRLRRGLVVAEIALAVVLLAGSGLLIRSLIRLLDVNPGFTSNGVLTARVSLSGDRYERTAGANAVLPASDRTPRGAARRTGDRRGQPPPGHRHRRRHELYGGRTSGARSWPGARDRRAHHQRRLLRCDGHPHTTRAILRRDRHRPAGARAGHQRDACQDDLP